MAFRQIQRSRLAKVILDFRFILVACSLVVAAAAGLKYALNPVAYNGVHHASYNNFVIFRNSFLNLLNHRDLYAWHLDEQWDLFKYSPSFAVLMAPFALVPVLPGLILWSLMNAVPLFIAIRMLPLDGPNTGKSDTTKVNGGLFIYLILIELVTNVQNGQSNGLVAALFLLTFVMLERDKPVWAALFTALNIAIKVFGVAGFVLFLLYPNRRKAIAWSIVWLAVVAGLPLLVVSPGELGRVYGGWLTLLRQDTVRANSLSFYGWMTNVFGLTLPRALVLAGSAVLLLLPLLRISLYRERAFRMLVLASVLIWVVIFNHKAESPTFIIAMCGIGTWFFAGNNRTGWEEKALLAVAFVLVSLSPTDIFPPTLRTGFFLNYSVKALPCIVIWFLVTAQLLLGFRKPSPSATVA